MYDLIILPNFNQINNMIVGTTICIGIASRLKYSMAMNGPEQFDNDRELAEMRRYNEAMMRAKYLGDLSVFRADVILKAQSLKLATVPYGWMYFTRVDYAVDANDVPHVMDLALIFSSEDVRLDMSRVVKKPFVRMFQSERFYVPYGEEWYTTDVSIDNDDDAMYFVDTYQKISDDSKKPLDIVTDSKVPMVYVQDGKLVFENQNSEYAPVMEIEPNIAPFGLYGSLYHSIRALEVAREMLNLFKDEEPIYYSRS